MPVYVRSDGARIDLIPDPFCKWCCKPIQKNFGETTGLCYNCYMEYGKDARPPLSIRAVGLYVLDGGWRDNQLSRDIWTLKNGDSSVADRIGECMVYILNDRFSYLKKIDLIVPIPSSDTSRQFNQAYLLAQYVSSKIRIELQDILYFILPHEAQHNIALEKKEINIIDNIGCRKRVDGKKILLIDDTYNTGNTAKECANVLKNMGAIDVNGLMAVRTIDKSHMNLVKSDE